jgi:hypothetical protein
MSSITLFSCNESLPARDDMSHLLSVKVRSKYYSVPNSNAAGQIQLFVTVKNNMDETLDDVVRMDGTLEITWVPKKEDSPNFTLKRTIKLSRSNIDYAKRYNPLSQRLTLEPMDSVVLSVLWNLKTDDSTYLMMYFPAVQEPSCYVFQIGNPPGLRRISAAQNFHVAASIKIFDRMAVLAAESIVVRHCVKGPDGGEANGSLKLPPCPDFTKVDPCSVIGQ